MYRIVIDNCNKYILTVNTLCCLIHLIFLTDWFIIYVIDLLFNWLIAGCIYNANSPYPISPNLWSYLLNKYNQVQLHQHRQDNLNPTNPNEPLPDGAIDDESISVVTPEVAKLSFPSKQAKKGFELGPVPTGCGQRRKSGSTKPKSGPQFLDDISDVHLKR